MTRRESAIRLALGAALLVALGAVAFVVTGREPGPGSSARPQQASAVDFHPVAGGFRPSETTLADCGPEDNRCLEQAYGNLSFTQGPKVAMRRFAADIARDSRIEAGCHRIAHSIGSAALARLDGNVSQAFSEGDATCWSGYYHGILEHSLQGAKSNRELSRRVQGVCLREELASDFLYYQCIHGLGHGLMISNGYDLPAALASCEALSGRWEVQSCSGGVFMENYSSSYGVRSTWLKDDDPLHPCDIVKETFKYYCYLQVTDRIFALNGFDWAAGARECASVEGTQWVEICFQSYGRSASGTSRTDNRLIAERCRVAGELRPAFEAHCFYGAVRDIVSNDAGPARAFDFCALARGRSVSICYFGISTILASLQPSEQGRATACAAAPAPQRRFCLGDVPPDAQSALRFASSPGSG